MEKFLLNNKSIEYSQLINNRLKLDIFSDYEKKILKIVKNWLSDEDVFTFQTSGSTGTPKEISFSREIIKQSAMRTILKFGLKSSDSILLCLNIEFVAGFMMVIRALEGNLNLIAQEPSSNPLNQIDLKQKIDFAAMTANQVENGLINSFDKIHQLKKLLIGGSALHPDLESQLQNVPSEVSHSYAMTETLTHVALRKVNGKEKSETYHALEGVSFSQDERNCLILHDKFLKIDGLVTNDIVELIDNTSFRWVGRYDNVINSGGIKIQVEEVEKEIRGIFRDLKMDPPFCLLSIPDSKLTNKMVLLIETNKNSLDKSAIEHILKINLPKYHAPKAIIQVPEIKHTKSGKIDRIRNTDLYLRNYN